MALKKSPYPTHESLLDIDPDDDRKLDKFTLEVDAALEGFDPHGRRTGFRGTVASPKTAAEDDGDPLSPYSEPVVMGAPVVASPQAGAEGGGSAGDTVMDDAPFETQEEVVAAGTLAPAPEVAAAPARVAKRSAETETETETGAEAPPKKRARKSEKAERLAAKKKMKQRMKARAAEKEKAAAAVAAAASTDEEEDDEEEEEEDDEDDGVGMADEEAAVDEEMELTATIRTFAKRIYRLHESRSANPWMALAFVEGELRNDAKISVALARSGYRNIEELILGSCGQTMSKMVATSRKRAHQSRDKAMPEVEEIDGLAAKFIEDSWHFRMYADIIQQYQDEGTVPEGERELGEVPDEDYEEDSFCVDDDASVGDASDSDPDGEYAAAAAARRRTKKKKKTKAAPPPPPEEKKKKKKTTTKKKSRKHKQHPSSGGGDDDDDGVLEELLAVQDAPAASAAVAVAAHEKAARGKSKGKKAGGPTENGAWDTAAIDRTVESPQTEWAAFAAVRARALEALKPVHRLGAPMPEDEFEEMLGALLKISRHVLTPFAAAANDASQVMSIAQTVGADMAPLVSKVSGAINAVAMSALKPSKKHIYRILEFFVCTAVAVEKTVVRDDVDVSPTARCIWTDAPIAPGQTVFRVRAFTHMRDAHVARVMYVSEAYGDYPERYIDMLSTLRAHRHWHFVFMRKLFDWQSRECFSASVTADMRMQRFLDSSDGIQAAATTLAEFFAHKHVIDSCLTPK